MDRVRNFLRGNPIRRIQRRKKLYANIHKRLPVLRTLLLLVGYAWMLALPLPHLGRGTYIDENALQPNQVNTYWDWSDVHEADKYLLQLETLSNRNTSSQERAEYLKTEFLRLGMKADTQGYTFTTRGSVFSGTNAYAVHAAPRASGAETMVISASWLSSLIDAETGERSLNLRGVSTVLALARYLRMHSLWAKDIVYVISDSYMDGMAAWLKAYHQDEQSNLYAEPLEHTSGVIWNGLNIDYPGHSFSHLGIFFEGLNGRLPNQDLLNSFRIISMYTGGVPVMVYDHLHYTDRPSVTDELLPSWLPTSLKEDHDVKEYAYRARNIARHVTYQSRGRASGVHGLLHQYRIDAITLFALPATGPHGFHAIGRVVESTLRTINNLLERLHASFFFYILTTPGTFLQLGHYLPSAILVSVALIFGGLGEWVKAGWIEVGVPDEDGVVVRKQWIRRKRPVVPVLFAVIATHGMGVALFFMLQAGVSTTLTKILPLIALFATTHIISSLSRPHPTDLTTAPAASILKAATLCLASTLISVTSVLNFSLALLLAALLGVPLSLSLVLSPSIPPTRIGSALVYFVLGFGWLWMGEQVKEALWNWEVLGVWFAPFVCVVYAPLVMQAAVAQGL